MKIKKLEELLRTGRSLTYLSSLSLGYAKRVVEESLPGAYSLFILKPGSITCRRYVVDGSEVPAYATEFEEKNRTDLTSLDALAVRLERCCSRFHKRMPGSPAEFIPPRSVILAVNMERELVSPEIQTFLQEMTTQPAYANYGCHIIMYSDVPTECDFLRRHGIELHVPPMSRNEIQEHLRRREATIADEKRFGKKSELFLNNKDLAGQLVESLVGLAPHDVDAVIDYGLLYHPSDKDPRTFTTYADEIQSRTIARCSMLTFLPPEQQIRPEFLRGFDAFLEYMEEAAVGFSEEARTLNLDPPKGVVLLGLPGTGKSMAAKALGWLLGLKTVILDMSSAFASHVGESESRIRQALKTVEDFGRCILVIDEADKALAGASGPTGDSGTTKRVLGTLLTWLQEKKSETFVILTMNDPSVVPPEFLRAGRFDKIFFTDLPSPRERREIIEAQFARRGVSVRFEEEEWERLADATDLCTGAELEEVVKESQRAAYRARKTNTPEFDEILSKASGRVPMARFDRERIDAIRNFCKNRAVSVSKEAEAEKSITWSF